MTYVLSTRHFPQQATYWTEAAADGYGGVGVMTPVPIKCRWEDNVMEVLAGQYAVEGQTDISQALVFTRTRLKQGGYLYLGTSISTDPSNLEGAFIIRAISTVPSVRNRFVEYIAHL